MKSMLRRMSRLSHSGPSNKSFQDTYNKREDIDLLREAEEESVMKVASIIMLPTELLIQIVAYLLPIDRFNLKLAGSRYILVLLNAMPKPTFYEYTKSLQRRQTPGLPMQNVLDIACMEGHNALVSKFIESPERIPRVNRGTMTLLDDIYSNAVANASAGSHLSTVKLLLRSWNRSKSKQSILTNGQAPVRCHEARRSLHMYNSLQHAAMNNDVEIAMLLLKHGAKTQGRNSPNSPLQLAAQYGHIKMVKLLLKHERWNAGSNLSSSLTAAAEKGHIDIVRLLLNAGAKVTRDLRYAGAVHLAARGGHIEVFDLLVQNGAKDVYVDYSTRLNDSSSSNRNIPEKGWSCLHFAIFGGHYDLVRYIVEHRIEPPIKTDSLKFKETALPIAVLGGHFEIVKFLLERGFAVDGTLRLGETPLHLATSAGDVEMMKLLLKHSANANSLTIFKDTPLHRATSCSAAILLLQSGADKEATNYAGDTALHIAARAGNLDLLNFFIAAGSMLDVVNTHGCTPTRCAIEKNHEAALSLLYASRASPKVPGNSGGTDLHFAATNMRSKMIVQILREGVYIESEDAIQAKPFHAAAEAGDKTCMELLLSEGANKEARDKYNSTALHYAAKGGADSAIQFLLEYGLNINETNSLGQTPLHAAAEYKHVSAYKLLLKLGADPTVLDARMRLAKDYYDNYLREEAYYNNWENQRRGGWGGQ